MGSGGSSGSVTFPQYQQDSHFVLLNWAGNVGPEKSITGCLNDALGNSPFAGYENINVDDLFLGSDYVVSDFPSVFDMFGKFLAGLDIEDLWSQIYQETVYGNEAEDLIKAHGTDLDYDMETEIYPRFHAGMRDINAVQSSSFVIGRAILETKRLDELAKYAAEVRYKLVLLVDDRWNKHLNWNQTVMNMYGELAKLYYTAKFDSVTTNYDIVGKDRLWDIRLFDYVRAFLGCLQGGAPAIGGQETSQVAKSISGAMGGAAMGASVGGGYGAVAGGVIGLAASFFT